MSLKFLAVGHTIASIRSEKSPYELRKENQLPTFQGAPRFKLAEKSMVQEDWLEQPKPSAPAAFAMAEPAITKELPGLAPQPSIAPSKRRGWFSFLRLRWFRTTATRRDLVQTELSLEKVQPLRNDLADADLRLVLKRKKKAGIFGGGAASASRSGWSELTARLFELGQK